MDGDAGH
jgi:hypothetical protein